MEKANYIIGSLLRKNDPNGPIQGTSIYKGINHMTLGIAERNRDAIQRYRKNRTYKIYKLVEVTQEEIDEYKEELAAAQAEALEGTH